MPIIIFKPIITVIAIILITIGTVLLISKFFNTNSKNNAKNIVQDKINELRK